MMTAMMVTPPMPETLTPTLSLSPPPVPATINAIPTTTLTMPMMVLAAMMVVQQLDRRADHEAMDLGDPLRGRALRSNRAARNFHCNPCRLRALRLPGASLRSPPRAGPPTRADNPDTVPTVAASASRRRYAPRSSPSSPRSPSPAAPATRFASARDRCAFRVVGAGFATHRTFHSRPHSCGRSCGARPHFVPHSAVHYCWPKCGRNCRRLRQRASHVCPRLAPHRRPLNRRGGSPPPASPASIPPSLSLGFPAVSTPCGVWVSHRNAAGCEARHTTTGVLSRCQSTT